ncbi:MAG: 50S ribosomal protein L29 [Candidatus Pacebacteria bacterium]|nr:50S ribosomal protein L29 [Candidatus Paceibacterota bacterium]
MAKKNTKVNFKEMKEAELKKELVSLREALRVIHFKAEGSRSKNVKESTILKKQIARAMTELNKK